MFNNMNVGATIKKTANILGILEILGYIIIAIAYVIIEYGDFSDGETNAVALGIGIGGSITAFVSNLALYGFGIIVEKYEDKNNN